MNPGSAETCLIILWILPCPSIYLSVCNTVFSWLAYCYYYYYYYYYYYCFILRKLMGKPWDFSAQDAILCQNECKSYENSGMTFTFMWNQESMCIHNVAYTIPLVLHGQGLVHSTCLTWDFLNTYHMFFHEAIRVCTTQATNYGNQCASPATWIWMMNNVTVAFGLLSLHIV